uniref:Immunoglobulin V-set domain-containing protein n=1 Tax=Capra hircus TaxID=9925 RepID=A0A8C2S513_CAPHI
MKKNRAGLPALSTPTSNRGLTPLVPGDRVPVQPGSVSGLAGHGSELALLTYGRVCRKIVETEGEEKEKRNGRVSIRDHTDNLTFTVTMENLNMNDAGSYWCRIQTIWILDVLSWDPSVQVEVSVFPGKSSLWSSSRATPPSPPARSSQAQSQSPDVHFLLLVFLKVPLFLGMLGAVLWVNRPLRSSGGKPQENQQPPCSSTFQEQKTLKQKEKAFFSGIDSRQWRLWFLRHRGSPLQELVP